MSPADKYVKPYLFRTSSYAHCSVGILFFNKHFNIFASKEWMYKIQVDIMNVGKLDFQFIRWVKNL